MTRSERRATVIDFTFRLKLLCCGSQEGEVAMAKVIKTTKRKRGVFGTIVWWLFLAFNGLMALWVFWAIKMAAQHAQATTDAAVQAGSVIGGTIATGLLVSLWLFGSLILGLIVALTRGKTVTVEETVA
ncbi:hypothetical protein [Sinorhizobium meliloti]|uniref:hypothetical protein n=1 Tax=Rhizobium meliloti TaxID=382 RepID=UPI000FD84CFE|nr:hypothetical protein [Sinorhizobium meliloti]RVL02490.1 hypothetical protein CN152_09845 [Sinorhizobium meliloti]